MNVSSPVHMVGRLLGETTYRSARSNSLSGGHPFSGRFYDVDPVTGFIPAQPLPRLTGEFTLWEDALEDARRVLKLGEDKGEEAQAKRASVQWPVLDAARLGDKRTVWRRAHYILTCLQHFYIHSLPPQPAKTPITIPKPLAVPLVEVSKKIDLPPILTFADIVLFSGTETEKNFYALSLAAELKGAEMVEIFERFMNLACFADRSAVATVARDLERLVPIINELSEILQGARSNIDPHIFYWVVRPWWNGSDASNPWVFEGVSPYTSFDLGGASAGQSSVMHALDIFLDVDHGLKQTRQPSPSPENRRADTRFMEKMRRYMPAEHRAYLTQLQSRSLRELVQRTPTLRAPYNAAVEALKKFRDGHIRIGTLYIISQARSVPPASMGGAEAFPQREDRSKGTGGNPVGVLLKAGRDATQRTLLRSYRCFVPLSCFP